ncbi:YDG domain-containing protein, partial [Flavobacterium sp.]|uniref:beta strand repeat-containing protein n=1 Tax=Flavobacterium sp. TaxID=239 RepID=UPI002602D68D
MKNTLLFKKANTLMFWCVALLLLCMPGKGYAQLLLTEDFSYGATAGNLQTIASPNWAAHSGTSNFVQYSTTGLTFSGHAGSGVGGAATVISSGAGDHNRTFTSQTSGTVYMSCLVRISAAAAGSDYFIHFNSGTFNARVAAQLSGSNIRFGISKAATPTVATTNFNLNTTYMVVVKYTFIAGSANDTCDLWVLPAFASTEGLAGAPLQSTAAGTDATALNAVAIRQGTAPSATIDAFRVGNTWADIAPSASLINGGTTSATAFTTAYGTASASQSFPVSGTLLSNPLVATAGTGFEVSRNDVVSYGATATYTAAEANAGGVSFLVRLKNNASAGSYNAQNAAVLSSSPAPNANIVTSASGNTVTPLGLTITGLSAQDKIFDGSTSATLTGTAILNGVLFSDDVTLGGSPSATFSSAAVGTWPVTVTGYTISGTKAANYSLAQPTVANATINPSSLIDQVITFPALSSVPYGTTSVSLLATSDNPGGNPIVYTSSNTNVATISGSTAVIVGAGTTTITASQAGDATHNPATNQTQSLTVTPLPISVTGISALDKPYDGTTTATLTGTAVLSPAPINSDDVTISGTPVANFATANVGTQAVTVTGYTISGTKAGNYSFTQPVIANATINQLTQTITTFNTIPSLNTLTGAITLNGIASSTLPVTFESSDTNVATISGNTLTVVGAGTVTITAKQAGNANYAAAPDVTQTRTVDSALYLNQFTGTSACPTQGNVATVVTNITGAAATRSTLTCASLNNFFSSTTLNATATINNNSYIEFSATAASGYRMNLTKLSFVRSGSGTAPNQLEVRYSTDGFVTSTSMNNSALTTTTATTLTWDFADFNSPVSGTITFRLYPYGTQRSDLGGTSAGTGTFRIDDVTIYGTVVVPPPTVTTTATPLAIASDSANLEGNVTSTGGSAVLGNGIVYSATDTTPTIGELGVIQLANPSPSAGTGAFSLSTGNTLSANTQYYFNAYANNAQGFAYGTPASFYTLANVPAQPAAASNVTTTTFDFSFDASNNPAATQYAIQVNSQYVQANGSLGASAVWQTDAQWQLTPTPHAITVTGLNPNTLYTYSLKARNGANVETALGTSNTVTTLPISTPTLTADPLTGFGNVCINTASSARTFGLLGELLVSDITIGPLAGYLFLNPVTSTYDTSITLSPDINGDLLEIISVKFNPTLVQSYDGNIPVSGGGAPTIYIAATGSGINTPATVTTGTVSSTTVVGATIAGTATAGCSAITATGIEYSTDSLFAGAVQVAGAFPITLNTLSPNTLYYVRAYANDSSAAGIAYGSLASFTTLGLTTGPVATAATSVGSSSFIANWEAVTGASSYLLDVSTNPNFLGALTTVANWSFPNATDDAVIDAGIAANNGKTITTVGGVGTLTYNVTSGSTTSAASGAGWNSGSGTKYWLIDIATTGYSDLKLSSLQRSSGTGPKDFKVQYSVNGGTNWFDVTGSTVVVGNNWTTGVLSDIALPSACDNQASVRLRWIMTSNTASSPGTVAAAGTSAIDSIVITGRPPSFTVYEGLSVNGLSQLISGLSELTEYHYRVRAYSANSTSANSNVIHVTTTAAAPTFDSVSYSGATVCEGANGTFDVSGLTPNVASRIYYDINGGTTENVLTTVADGSGAATFSIALPLSANSQLLTITKVERADASSFINVDSNNIVFITGIAANVTYYADADTDTYGNPAVSQVSCTGAPSGYVINNTDCDDSDITKHDSFPFYTDADGDGVGAGTATSLCAVNATTPPTAGYSVTNTDCNDSNINIYQFATFYVDADGDTYGSTTTASVCSGLATPAGYSTTNDDCDDTDADLNPANPCATGKVVNLTLFVESYYIG